MTHLLVKASTNSNGVSHPDLTISWLFPLACKLTTNMRVTKPIKSPNASILVAGRWVMPPTKRATYWCVVMP